MDTLLVLAYNEEENISEVILSLKDEFDDIIVVNDSSQDSTESLLKKLSLNSSKIKILTNSKNLGAGKSFEVGVKAFLESSSSYLVKIDGDGQFNKKDVLNIKKLLNESNFDFIKCDRFWEKGIEGKIPLIRYFGNAFASLLLKFSTGNWMLNDPLNGLMGFSKESLIELSIPKKFNRYGYPFYVTTSIFYISFLKKLNIGQYRNIVKYSNEKSNLNALTMFFKLVSFTITNFFSKISRKLSNSKLQISAIIDIFASFIFSLCTFSIYKFLTIRFFNVDGGQGTWFLLFIIFFIMFLGMLYISQKIENDFSKNYVEEIH
jgi:glycosyltransferase involved in cell wall biosynthesis